MKQQIDRPIRLSRGTAIAGHLLDGSSGTPIVADCLVDRPSDTQRNRKDHACTRPSQDDER